MIAIILFIQGTLLQLFTHNSIDSAPHNFRSLTPNETIIDLLNNTIIDPLHQLLSKYDIPVSALDCDGGKEVVSSFPPPRLYPNGSAVLCVIVLNERPYIDEWINYHLGLGFSKIVVYDNSESNELKPFLIIVFFKYALFERISSECCLKL